MQSFYDELVKSASYNDLNGYLTQKTSVDRFLGLGKSIEYSVLCLR